MEDKQTLCWHCNTAYQMSCRTCPKCGATNGNHDLYLAKAECDNPALIVSPEKARLIAAAPNMFAALLYYRDECSGYEPSISVFARMVDEAIAEATGACHE